jgi:hypothetical protein
MAWAAVGAAAIGAGASIYGASKADAGSAPAHVNPLRISSSGKSKGTSLAGRQAQSLFKNYYPTAIPLALQTSEQYGPQFMGQMFNQTGQFLGGVNGQPGFNALQLSSAQQAGKTLQQIRAEELGQMTGQAGLTRGLMQSLSPEQAAVVQGSAQEAERARAAARNVTPEEKRMYEQTAREAAQASGRLGGNSSIAAEVMGRQNLMAGKRQEAAAAGTNAFNQAGSFYTQPGLQALSNAPLSYNAGQKDLALGLQLGPQSSGEFDYNMPINLAMSQAGAQNAANSANYQINAANQQARASAFSSIGGGLMGFGLGGMSSGGGFANLGNAVGSPGIYNYGANSYNANAGYNTPPKALYAPSYMQ